MVEYKTYTKNDVIRQFKIVDDKVLTTIGDIINPTIEQFIASGWKEYIEPTPEPELPTYADLVEQYIQEHGYPTYGAELAVLNNYAENPSEYIGAWQTYMSVRRAAKEWAEQQPHKED